MVTVCLDSAGRSGIGIQSWSFWSVKEKFLAVVSVAGVKRLQPILNSCFAAKRPSKLGHHEVFLMVLH